MFEGRGEWPCLRRVQHLNKSANQATHGNSKHKIHALHVQVIMQGLHKEGNESFTMHMSTSVTTIHVRNAGNGQAFGIHAKLTAIT